MKKITRYTKKDVVELAEVLMSDNPEDLFSDKTKAYYVLEGYYCYEYLSESGSDFVVPVDNFEKSFTTLADAMEFIEDFFINENPICECDGATDAPYNCGRHEVEMKEAMISEYQIWRSVTGNTIPAIEKLLQ